MRRYLDTDAPPRRPGDFGFWHSEAYVWEACPLVEKGILPQPGGWDDQTTQFRDDYYTWSRLYAYVAAKKRAKEAKREAEDGDVLDEIIRENGEAAQDWRGIIGERA